MEMCLSIKLGTQLGLLLAIVSSVSLAPVCFASADGSFGSWSGVVHDASPRPVIHTPRSTEQVIAIVKKSVAEGKKIRVSGARHSWNSVIIGDTSVYLSTVNLTKVGAVAKKAGKASVVVGAGVMLGDLTDHLYKKGYSLGFAMPEFRGLTIGGLIATGSHGSSRRYAAVSPQIVKSLKLVTASGAVLDLSRNDGDLFKAATVSLGALGVVTELELELVPRFNVKMTSSVMDLTQASFSDFINAAPKEDFLFAMWFPRLKKVVLESGVMTKDMAEKGAENIMFGANAGTTEADYAVADFLAKGRGDATGNIEAAIEAKRFDGLVQKPRFVIDVDGFDVNKSEVVGPANKMLIARGNTITWPYKLSDYSFSFPASELIAVMKTIEDFSTKNNYSFPNAGISMRFVRSDGGESSLLSQFEDSVNSKQLFVSAEFLEFRPFGLKGETTGPREHYKYEILDLLVKNHGVKFHLGKNDDRVLKSEPGYSHTADQYKRFETVAKQLDPAGTFSSNFVSELVATRVSAQ